MPEDELRKVRNSVAGTEYNIVSRLPAAYRTVIRDRRRSMLGAVELHRRSRTLDMMNRAVLRVGFQRDTRLVLSLAGLLLSEYFSMA